MGEIIGMSIEIVLSNFTVTALVLGLLTALVGVWRIRRRAGAVTAADVWGRLLDHFLLWSVGIAYVYNFVMHSVFGDFTAEIIGWSQSPFQLEVAFASLGFALVGFLAFPRRQPGVLKLAALLGPAVFLWGAAGGHIFQIATTGNEAQGNAGSILYTDILLPVVGFVLYIAAARTGTFRRNAAYAGEADLGRAHGRGRRADVEEVVVTENT